MTSDELGFLPATQLAELIRTKQLSPVEYTRSLLQRIEALEPEINAFVYLAADQAMDAAACIGCGACVAACKNASAMLFVSAKVSHLASLPQGKTEREQRVLKMVKEMDQAGFGNCTVTGSCEAVCPKEISLNFIAQMNREYGKAILKNTAQRQAKGGD